MTYPIASLAAQTAKASIALARVPSAQKDAALRHMAQAILDHTAQILAANTLDCNLAKAKDTPSSFLDRLALSQERVNAMAQAILEVADLEDPVGQIESSWTRPNGLQVSKKRIPLGTIGIIYEARPNVTSDAAALCFKSGNAVLLKGGSAALRSNQAIFAALQEGLGRSDLPKEAKLAIAFVDSTERHVVQEMLTLSDSLDLVIPRGGKSLIQFVHQHAKVPVIKHDEGICHLVIDASAHTEDVLQIALNAKTQRPSTCNSVETILVLENAVDSHLPPLLKALSEAGVTLHLDPQSLAIAESLKLPNIHLADDEAWAKEFLTKEVALKVLPDLDAAIAHIDRFGSNHTESLLTQSLEQSTTFTNNVNSSVVMINASTRFSDGNQLGLGAEIGISTTRMHAYGPMGLKELTTTKFVVLGQGQIRP